MPAILAVACWGTRDARAFVLTPSPPAQLTSSKSLHELEVHADASGLTIGVIGYSPSLARADSFVLALGNACSEDMVERPGFDSRPFSLDASTPSEANVSLSADGLTVALCRPRSLPSSEIVHDVHVVDRGQGGAVHDYKDHRVTYLGSTQQHVLPTSPRLHLSADGSTLFLNGCLIGLCGNPLLEPNYLYQRRAPWPLPPPPAEPPDPTVHGKRALGRSQSAVSADGRYVAASENDNLQPYRLFRMDITSGTELVIHRDGQSLPATYEHDATLSGDGTRAMWTSPYDGCDGAFPRASNSTWAWYENGIPAGLPQVPRCPSPGGVGSVVRLTTTVAPYWDSRPFITAIGARGFFISTADHVPGRNPDHRATLFTVDLETGGIEQPVVMGNGESVAFATANADGTVITYSRKLDDGVNPVRHDLFLMRLDHPGVPLSPYNPSLRRPHQPFDVEIPAGGCSVVGGDVQINATLRQYNGPDRPLIVRYEVEGASGRVVTGPYVQPMRDGMQAALHRSVPTGITSGTCRVVVIDGTQAQADVASDALAFN